MSLQICLQMGFGRNEPWLYLSGDNPELLDVYPELGYLRDIVYILKAFMAPTSDALPEVRPPARIVGVVYNYGLFCPSSRHPLLVVVR